MAPERPYRFADYFAIISAAIPKEKPRQPTHNDPTLAVLSPHVSDYYPSKQHADLSFPAALSIFCFPDGVPVYWDPYRPATWHSFVMTDASGKRIYGTCVVFDEKASGELMRAINYDPRTGHHKLEQTRGNNKSDGFLRVGKAICLLSHWPYLQAHRGILRELYHLSQTQSTVPLERYVASLIHDVPLPPQGRTAIVVGVGGYRGILTRPPRNKLPLCDLPVHQLFQVLDASTVLVVMRSILTERRTLFVSSQTSLLTIVIETILTVLFPFEWLHIYVPVLPSSLMEYIYAPTPYIIGVTSHQMESWNVQLQDVVIVDLDTSTVSITGDEPPPELPEQISHVLVTQLEDLTQHLFDRDRIELANADYVYENAKTGQDVSPLKQLTRNLRLAVDAGIKNLKKTSEFDVGKTRQAFLDFFVGLLQDYRDYTLPLTAESMSRPGQDIFDRDAFLEIWDDRDQPFIRELIHTQLFDAFVNKRIDPQYDTDMPVVADTDDGAEIQLFDEYISLVKARANGIEADTPFLDDWTSEVRDNFTVAPVDISKVHQKLFRYSTFPNISARLRHYRPRPDAIPEHLRGSDPIHIHRTFTPDASVASMSGVDWRALVTKAKVPGKVTGKAAPPSIIVTPAPPAKMQGGKPAAALESPKSPTVAEVDTYLSAVLERATEIHTEVQADTVPGKAGRTDSVQSGASTPHRTRADSEDSNLPSRRHSRGDSTDSRSRASSGSPRSAPPPLPPRKGKGHTRTPSKLRSSTTAASMQESTRGPSAAQSTESPARDSPRVRATVGRQRSVNRESHATAAASPASSHRRQGSRGSDRRSEQDVYDSDEAFRGYSAGKARVDRQKDGSRRSGGDNARESTRRGNRIKNGKYSPRDSYDDFGKEVHYYDRVASQRREKNTTGRSSRSRSYEESEYSHRYSNSYSGTGEGYDDSYDDDHESSLDMVMPVMGHPPFRASPGARNRGRGYDDDDHDDDDDDDDDSRGRRGRTRSRSRHRWRSRSRGSRRTHEDGYSRSHGRPDRRTYDDDDDNDNDNDYDYDYQTRNDRWDRGNSGYSVYREFGFGPQTRANAAARLQAFARGIRDRHNVTGLIKRERARILERLGQLWQQLSVSLLYRSEFYHLILKSPANIVVLRLARMEMVTRERQLNTALGLPQEDGHDELDPLHVSPYPGLREASLALIKERRMLFTRMRRANESVCPKVPDFVYIAFGIDHKSKARKKQLMEALWQPSLEISAGASAVLVRALYALPRPLDWKQVEYYAQHKFFKRGAKHHRDSSESNSTRVSGGQAQSRGESNRKSRRK